MRSLVVHDLSTFFHSEKYFGTYLNTTLLHLHSRPGDSLEGHQMPLIFKAQIHRCDSIRLAYCNIETFEKCGMKLLICSVFYGPYETFEAAATIPHCLGEASFDRKQTCRSHRGEKHWTTALQRHPRCKRQVRVTDAEARVTYRISPWKFESCRATAPDCPCLLWHVRQL